MTRIIGEHYEGDVKVTWRDDGDQIGVHYQQNINPLLDNIAAINASGGAKPVEGMGALKYEFPVSLLMEHAIERGIPWEKLAHTNEYDEEWPRMAAKWSKLSIDQKRTYF